MSLVFPTVIGRALRRWCGPLWSFVLLLAFGAMPAHAALSIQWHPVTMPTTNCYTGATIQFAASVTNPAGGEVWDSATRLELSDHAGRVIYAPSVANVGPGATTTVTFYLTLPATVGTYEYVLTAKREGSGPGSGYFGEALRRSITVQFQPTVPVGTGGSVWLDSYSFKSVAPPVITTNWATSAHYRLRAKIAVPWDGLGFHAATSVQNKGLPLDAVPPPGYYPTMTLYWARYDENYVLQEISPGTNRSVTISDPPVILSSYWVNQRMKPTVTISQNLPMNYRLIVEVIDTNDVAVTNLTQSWNNDTRFLAELPGPGNYRIRTRWARYNLAGDQMIATGTPRTQDFTVVEGPMQIFSVAGTISGNDVVDEYGEPTGDREYGRDWHSFEVPRAGQLRLFSGTTPNFWPQYELYGPDGAMVASGRDQPSIDVTLDLLQAGGYSLKIGDDNDGDYVVAAVLTLPGTAPQITNAALPSGTLGAPYSDGVYITTDVASTAANKVVFHADDLPLGLRCDAATGRISGTPAQAGTFTIRLWASNNAGDGLTKPVSLTIAKATPVLTFANRTFVNELRMHAITAAMLNATVTGLPGMPAPTPYAITYRVSQGTSLTPTGSNPLGKYLSSYDQPVVKITATYPGDTIYAETTVEATFRDVIEFTPTPPAEVRAVLRSSGGFSLAWQSAGGVPPGITTDFLYDISVDGGQTVLATVPYGQLSSVVVGRNAATPYAVSVRARDLFGNQSAWSNPPVAVTTLAVGETPVTVPRWLSLSGNGLLDEVIDAGTPAFEHSIIESNPESVTYSQWVQYWMHIPGYTYSTRSFLDDALRRYYVPPHWDHEWVEETQEITVTMVRPEFRAVPRDDYEYRVGRIFQRADGTYGLNEVYTVNPDDTISGINRWLPPGPWSEPVYYTIPFVLVRKSLAPGGCVLSLPGLGTVTAGKSNGTITLGNGTKITAGPTGTKVEIPGVGTVTIGTNGTVSVAGGGALPAGVVHTPGVPSLGLPGGITVNPGTNEVTVAGPAGSAITVGSNGIKISLPQGLGGTVQNAVDEIGNLLGIGADASNVRTSTDGGAWGAASSGGFGSLGTGDHTVRTTTDQRATPAPENIITITIIVQPRMSVKEVGFTEDTGITQWSPIPALRSKIDFPDGSAPTWKSENNPNLPVSYPIRSTIGGVSYPAKIPKLFAKLAVATTTNDRSVTVRVKEGASILATVPNVTVANSEVTLSGVECALSRPAYTQRKVHLLTWEISINSSDWSTIGTTTHTVYWTENEPLTAPLYDFALAKACLYVALYSGAGLGPAPTSAQIAQSICVGLYEDLIYNPGRENLPEVLMSYLDTQGVQCSMYSRLMVYLLDSIGIHAEDPIYIWGGSSVSRITLYEWNHPVSGVYSAVSFQCDRPAHPTNNLGSYPKFSFHAVVGLNGQYFDPTYGVSGLPSLVEFAPADRDNLPFGNFPTFGEDIDWNGNGVLDVSQKRQGTEASFNSATVKYFNAP